MLRASTYSILSILNFLPTLFYAKPVEISTFNLTGLNFHWKRTFRSTSHEHYISCLEIFNLLATYKEIRFTFIKLVWVCYTRRHTCFFLAYVSHVTENSFNGQPLELENETTPWLKKTLLSIFFLICDLYSFYITSMHLLLQLAIFAFILNLSFFVWTSQIGAVCFNTAPTKLAE